MPLSSSPTPSAPTQHTPNSLYLGKSAANGTSHNIPPEPASKADITLKMCTDTDCSHSSPALSWPEFPEEFRSKLPSQFTEKEKEELRGCFCPTCAKDLCDCLADHPQAKVMNDLHSPTIGWRQHDVRQVLECLQQHLEPLKQFASGLAHVIPLSDDVPE
jgi:hypothetical protein